MKNKEKFEAFKKKLVADNEEKYGAEAREKYGEDAVDESNRKMLNMTEEVYARFTELGKQINEKLQAAVEGGVSPESETGKEIAMLHKEWLCCTWKTYSAAAHRDLAEMYVADERFAAYYDAKVPGCADFLNRAIKHWVEA